MAGKVLSLLLVLFCSYATARHLHKGKRLHRVEPPTASAFDGEKVLSICRALDKALEERQCSRGPELMDGSESPLNQFIVVVAQEEDKTFLSNLKSFVGRNKKLDRLAEMKLARHECNISRIMLLQNRTGLIHSYSSMNSQAQIRNPQTRDAASKINQLKKISIEILEMNNRVIKWTLPVLYGYAEIDGKKGATSTKVADLINYMKANDTRMEANIFRLARELFELTSLFVEDASAISAWQLVTTELVPRLSKFSLLSFFAEGLKNQWDSDASLPPHTWNFNRLGESLEKTVSLVTQRTFIEPENTQEDPQRLIDWVTRIIPGRAAELIQMPKDHLAGVAAIEERDNHVADVIYV